MAILDTIQSIYEIGAIIYEIVETVQANKAQCQRLAGRVKLVEGALRGLDKDHPSSNEFSATLIKLKIHLNEIEQFIRKFSKKTTFKQFYNYSTYQAKFAELNQELVELIPILSLGLNAHQVVNQEHDRADQTEDQTHWEQLFVQQAEIQAGQQHLIHQGERVDQKVSVIHAQIESQRSALDRKISEIQAGLLNHFGQQEEMWLLLQNLPNLLQALPTPPTSPTAAAEDEEPAFSPRITIKRRSLTLGKLLSGGEGGEIHQGQWLGQEVAVKSLTGHYSYNQQWELVREMKALEQFHHPRIVRFYGWCTDETKAYLVMEHCKHLDLARYLQQHPNLSLNTKRKIAVDIAQGLQYLHEQGFLHRDLNSRHVLLDENLRAKLTDFRISKDPSLKTLQSIHPTQSNTAWRAPETLTYKNQYTPNSDIYSFGIVLWEIMTQQAPFASLNSDDITHSIQNGERLPLPQTCPAQYATLIEACWAANPEARPSLTEILHTLEDAPIENVSTEILYKTAKDHQRAGEFIKALSAYQAAAEQGHANAFTSIGMFYLDGLASLEKDKQAAHHHFQKGANGGHGRAMFNLAEQFKRGDGTTQDFNQALFWFDRAAEQNTPEAAESAARLRSRLKAASNSGSSGLPRTEAMAP